MTFQLTLVKKEDTMKILKRIAIGFVVLVLILLAVSFFLPANWKAERSVTIDAPASVIFPYINTLKKWPEWTVWYEREPNLQVSYEGPEAGVGAVSRWSGKDGAGEMRITDSRADQAVGYDLIFNQGEFRLRGEIELNAAAGATHISWRSSGDTGVNPVHKYFALMMETWIGRDLEQSLAKLKSKLGKP